MPARQPKKSGYAEMDMLHRSAQIRARLRRLALALAAVSVCSGLATGCREIPNGFVGGETLTPEALREISASVFTQPAEPDNETVAADPALSGYGKEVYWLDGGSVAHTDRGCYHIAHSENVRSGSPDDAIAAGKTALCASCRKSLEASDTSQPSDSK